jgi:uncharacterized protein YjiS (DUF1127 family)
MNAPISTQEVQFLLSDTEAARRGASVAAEARRNAPPSTLVRVAQNAVAWLKAWPARRAAMSELAGLTDRELADIGLTRQSIPQLFTHR